MIKSKKKKLKILQQSDPMTKMIMMVFNLKIHIIKEDLKLWLEEKQWDEEILRVFEKEERGDPPKGNPDYLDQVDDY